MARAVSLLVWAGLRRRWASMLVVVVMVGLAGGATLAAVAGARRTASSYDRFLEVARSQDVLVFAHDVRPADVARVRELPGVKAAGRARVLALMQPNGQPLNVPLAITGALDDAVLRDVYRLRIVRGRSPEPSEANEIVVGEPFARSGHLHVGDTLTVAGATQEQVATFGSVHGGDQAFRPAGPHVRLRIVGISRMPEDLSLAGAGGGELILPRPFVARYGDRIGNPDGAILAVRLDRGSAGIPRFISQLRDVLPGGQFEVDPAAASRGGVQESIDVLALAVLVFGVITGVAGLIAVGMAINRQLTIFASDQAVVADLGLTRRHRAQAAGGPLFIAVATGSVIALIAAWLVSPLLPFGVARQAEPSPGFDFDPIVLAGGAVLIILVLGVFIGVTAWYAVRRRSMAWRPRRSSFLNRSLESIGLAPPATIGVRMALEPGRGSTAAPVRSALFGGALAVLGVVAVIVFSGSLDRLLDSPAAFGRPWNVTVTDLRAEPIHADAPCGQKSSRLLDDPAVEAIAAACSASVTINGRAVGSVGITPLRGSLNPTVLQGRVARGADEVALGTDTMRRNGVEIGDDVEVDAAGRPARYRVVGRVIVPRLIEPQAIADGAVFTGSGLDRLRSNGAEFTDTLVLRFRHGIDEAAAAARINRLDGIGTFGQRGVTAVPTPLEVQRLEQIRHVPQVLALFLTVLGAIAVSHLLITSVRRRRRDLAVLKTIGFGGRQLMVTIACQATTIAVIASVIGLLLGIATGANLWRATAHHVGVLAQVHMSVPLLIGAVLAALLVSNAVAAVPARHAARLPAATILRTE